MPQTVEDNCSTLDCPKIRNGVARQGGPRVVFGRFSRYDIGAVRGHQTNQNVEQMKTPPPIPDSDLKAGITIGNEKFRLSRRLARGGNGVVWLAKHLALNQDVVVKFPLSSAGAQLETEIGHLAKYSNRHPNIVNILDVDSFGGRPFIVSQYLEGGSLQDYLFGQSSPQATHSDRLHERANWVVEIASALDFLHDNGILHCDVKPANILFDSSMSAYLSDFGIAESVRCPDGDAPSDATVSGSIPYMAPELFHSGIPSPASDQFALAVTIFEFLAGRRPFSSKVPGKLVDEMDKSPGLCDIRPGVAKELESALQKGLCFDPNLRFSNCRLLAEEIVRHWPIHFDPAGEYQATGRSTTTAETHQVALATKQNRTDSGMAIESAGTTIPGSNPPSPLDMSDSGVDQKAGKRVVRLDRLLRKRKS